MAPVIYHLLKNYCRIALKFYFKKYQIAGQQNIPPGPVIFVPNHQNAFLDAVLTSCSTSKNPWFIARADVFNKPVVAWLLSQLRMLPVFRFRDGFGTIKNNDKTFRACIEKLNHGESVIIFAEGNHSTNYQLRNLQKGFARMALGTDPDKNVQIVPVGIQYDAHSKFQTRVLVNFGKPVAIPKLPPATPVTSKSYDQLVQMTEAELKTLMLHIDEDRYDEKILYLNRNKVWRSDLLEQLHHDQKTIASFPTPAAGTLENPERQGWKKLLYWYFSINVVIPKIIIRKMILPSIKDPQFVGSIQFSTGMILVPLMMCLQAFLIAVISGSPIAGIVYLLSIPLSLKLS